MWNKVARNFVTLVIASMLSSCATAKVSNQASADASDSGYFLSLEQKGQLIWKGQVQDAAGIWYDIWIVPGYANPAMRAKNYTLLAGSDLAEYVEVEKYRDLAKDSKKAYKWAYDDCLVDFTLKGVPRAWGDYWSSANSRTSQRVFGWWFAYPWATLEGTVNTIVRVPVGLTGATLGTIWGTAVVPGYYATNSVLKGAWHFGVDAVIFPTIGGTWNTMIAPPLSLAGQQPAPSRVDGFWVKRLSEQDILTEQAKNTPISREEVAALADWGQLLLNAGRPYEDRRLVLRKEIQAEHAIINHKSQQAEAAIKAEEKETIRVVTSNPSQQKIASRLQNGGFNYTRTILAADEVRGYLSEQNQMSPADIQLLIDLLRDYPPVNEGCRGPLRPKTDPVTHGLKVISEVD